MASKKLVPLRSMSTEPQAVPNLQDADKDRPFSVEPILLHDETHGQLRSDAKIASSAKVTAWLDTLSSDVQDDDDESQGPRDAIDITAARRSSLLLEPITGSHLEGQGDGETLDQLRGKPIPPITSSKSEETGNDATSEKDKTGSENSISCAEDIHSSRATIDSETSSAGIASSQTNGESTPPKGKELDVDEGDEEPRSNQFKKNFIIKVKEANQPTDSTLTAKQTEIVSKLFRRKSSSVNAEQSKGADSSKLSFGGVANTLLQWKIHKARAVKRRSQSIAIDARHFALMGAIADKIKTELPQSLIQSLKEEAQPILVQTVQGYKREIGKSHRLTIQAQKRLDELNEELRDIQ